MLRVKLFLNVKFILDPIIIQMIIYVASVGSRVLSVKVKIFVKFVRGATLYIKILVNNVDKIFV